MKDTYIEGKVEEFHQKDRRMREEFSDIEYISNAGSEFSVFLRQALTEAYNKGREDNDRKWRKKIAKKLEERLVMKVRNNEESIIVAYNKILQDLLSDTNNDTIIN